MVVRCTKKMLELLGGRSVTLSELPPSDNDWYLNLVWIERQKSLLLTHTGALFSVLRIGVPVADLRPLGDYLVGAIQIELRAEGLPADTFSGLEPDSVQLAKTASHSTLGFMTEMAFELGWIISDNGGLRRSDINELNHALRRMLWNRSDYVRPIELVKQHLHARTGPAKRLRTSSPTRRLTRHATVDPGVRVSEPYRLFLTRQSRREDSNSPPIITRYKSSDRGTLTHNMQAIRWNACVETIRCAAILFDLDGVLIDSGAAVERAWGRWAARHGLGRARVLAEAHGRRTTDTIRSLAPWLDVEAETRALEEAETADTDGVIALAGAVSLLESLPAGSWAVATSGTRRLAMTRLAAGGLPVPHVLVTAEDVEHGKPDPQPYIAAAEALGVEPSACLIIEDAPAGVAAGKAAGAMVVAVATTFAAAGLKDADHVAPSLAAVRVRAVTDSGGQFGLEVVLES